MHRSTEDIQAYSRPASTELSGAGIGLRNPHMAEILQQKPSTPWFEIISDNFISHNKDPLGGLDTSLLFAIREHYPISMHGVGMSLGSVDPLDWNYIKAIKTLSEELDCQWISEHAAFVSLNQKHYHDLLPLPYTEEAVSHLSERIAQVQDFLGHPLLIENATSYIHCNYDSMSDGEFLRELVKRSGCHLLIDINNLYVNQHNHGWCASDVIDTVPMHSVKEIHLAGFSENDQLLIDSHSAPVAEPVWKLYQQALNRFGQTPTLIEWDNNIPAFEVLQEQARRAEGFLQQARNLKRAPNLELVSIFGQEATVEQTSEWVEASDFDQADELAQIGSFEQTDNLAQAGDFEPAGGVEQAGDLEQTKR